jgi:colanic acid biosynthesis glycosyl transferase WcaI
VAAVPAPHLAARTLRDSGAGIAVPPDDAAALSQLVSNLLADPAARERRGRAGRHYAEAELDIGVIAERFEKRLFTDPRSPEPSEAAC